MAESDYYPVGAYKDQSAPYNEHVIQEREFHIGVEYVISKEVDVTTNDFVPEYDEEDGHVYANTDDTDWESAYKNSGHLTIPELLDELKNYVIEDMKTCSPKSGKGSFLKRLLESCNGWEIQEKKFEY